jgi:hypothetical protein
MFVDAYEIGNEKKPWTPAFASLKTVGTTDPLPERAAGRCCRIVEIPLLTL